MTAPAYVDTVSRRGRQIDLAALGAIVAGAACYGRAWLGMRALVVNQNVITHERFGAAGQRWLAFRGLSWVGIGLFGVGIAIAIAAAIAERRLRRAPEAVATS